MKLITFTDNKYEASRVQSAIRLNQLHRVVNSHVVHNELTSKKYILVMLANKFLKCNDYEYCLTINGNFQLKTLMLHFYLI